MDTQRTWTIRTIRVASFVTSGAKLRGGTGTESDTHLTRCTLGTTGETENPSGAGATLCCTDEC